ncbi:MAG: hypothetical protein HON70_38650, partial [Lentisphaerae bacterium]|nr:hypothetical protein [Lentisphaerota bacterium]
VFRTAHETELPNGTHRVLLTAVDRAGNLSEVAAPGVIAVENPLPDGTPPSIHIESPLIDDPDQVFSGDVPFTVTATDNGLLADVTILFDGEEAVSVNTDGSHAWLLDCTAFADGYHTLIAVATDEAGNTTTSDRLEFLTSRHAPDRVRPELRVTMTDTAAGADLHLSASDNQELIELRVLLDGATHASKSLPDGTASGEFDVSLSTAELGRTVIAEAMDRYGNIGRQEIAVPATEDDTEPTVGILYVAPGDTDPIRGTVNVTIEATDNRVLRRVDLLLDGAVFASHSFPTAAQLLVVIPPEALSDGAHTLVARATDTAGNRAESAPRTVSTSNPIVGFAVSPAVLEPGLPTGTSIAVSARLQIAAEWRLDIAGPTPSPAITGTGTDVAATIDAAMFADGDYTITLRAAGVEEGVTTSFEVNLITGPPIAELEFPGREEAIPGGVVRIEDGLYGLTGTADDPDPGDDVAYRVLLLKSDGAFVRDVTPQPVDGSGWHVGRVLSSDLGTIDFTTTRNGLYTLRLAVRGGVDVSFVETAIALDSSLKVGHFGFSQQDLLIPVAGIPISVIRTYSSLNAEAGAFGVGWTHAIADVQLEFDEDRMMAEDETGALFSKRRGGGRSVALTLPGGDRVAFAFTPQPDFMGYRAQWTARDGVYATLVPSCTKKITTLPFMQPYWEASGPATPMEAFDIPGFELTTRDGTRYVIEREDLGEFFELDLYTGQASFVHAYGEGTLRRVEQRTGDVLLFKADGSGIDHLDPSGTRTRSVVFQRDDRERITAVFGPASQDGVGAAVGPADVTYEYDGVGNLTKVNKLTDRPSSHYDTTEFVYDDAAHPHHMTAIKDPRGIQPLRSEYDADGRLVATIDADGNRVELEHDLANRTETVYDRLGNPTLHVYDTRGNVIATTNAHGYTTRRTYDRFSNETSVTNPLGLTTIYSYDERGNRTSVTDALGNTTTYTYDAFGNKLSTTDALGNTTTTEYDQQGNPVATVDALGNRQTTAFDANGHLTAVRDASGNTVLTLDYDAAGNMVKTVDVTGIASVMQHDSEGRETARAMEWVNPDDLTDVRLVSNETEYNAAGQAVRSVDPRGNVSTHEYNALGKVVRSTDHRGQTTEQTYDVRGQVIRTRYPGGAVVETVYDANGRTVVQTDRHQPGEPANGSRTVYDKLGRTFRRERIENVVVQIAGGPTSSAATFVGADGLLWRTSTEYNAAGQVTATTDANGVVRRQYYDESGRAIASEVYTPGNGGELVLAARQETDYDAVGRQIAGRDSEGNETRFFYDALGRRVKTLFPDDTSVSTTYNSLGRRVAETDQLGQTTRYAYDAAGQLIAVTLPGIADPEAAADQDGVRPRVSPRYEYTHDPYRRLRATTDPKGRVTKFTYDEFGQQLTRMLPLGQTENRAYNSLGQLESQTDFKGQTSECDYDTLGRLVEKRLFSAPDGGPVSPAATLVYTHDDLGRLQTITETQADGSTRITEYTYDQNGRLIRLAAPEGTIDYAYDPATGQHTRTTTSHTETWYGHDDLGRLETVTVTREDGRELGEPRAVSYAYDDLGRRAAQQLPNGTTTFYDYDSLNRLTSIAHHNATDDLLASFNYTLRPDGRRVAVEEMSFVVPPSGGSLQQQIRQIAYTYDALNRLTAESSGGETPAAVRYTTDYTYDLVGNRLRKRTERQVDPDNARLELTDAQFDANDRLISETLNDHGQVTERSHTFDPNGSLVESLESAEGTGETVSSAAYTYNVQNRLAGALIARTETDATGNKIPVEIETSYAYNHSGMRVAAASSVFDVSTGVRTTQYVDDSTAYLIDPHNPSGYTQVLEEHSTNGLERSYTIGDDILAQTDSASSLQPSHFLYDGHGNTRALTDVTGTITDTFAYDAYGVLLDPQPTAISLPQTDLLYAGEKHDTALAMNYHRARYYNPQSTTWNRLDPYAGDPTTPQSLNKYAFCHQDPVNGIDPSGEITLFDVMFTVTQSTALRTFYAGAVLGGVTSSVFTLLMRIAKADAPFTAEFWSDREMWYDVGAQGVQGAIVGGLSALAGIPFADKAKSLSMASKLPSIFSREVLAYIGVPAAIKGLIGTALAFYNAVVVEGRTMWSSSKIAETLIFSTASNFLFDFGQLSVSWRWNASRQARVQVLVDELDRPFRIWRQRTGRRNGVNTAEVERLVRAISRTRASLGWMSGAYASFVFQLTQKFAAATTPLE